MANTAHSARAHDISRRVPVDPEHAEHYLYAKDRRVDDAYTISECFLALETIAESLDTPDVTSNGMNVRMLLLAISAAGTAATDRQNMLINPESFRSPHHHEEEAANG